VRAFQKLCNLCFRDDSEIAEITLKRVVLGKHAYVLLQLFHLTYFLHFAQTRSCLEVNEETRPKFYRLPPNPSPEVKSLHERIERASIVYAPEEA